MENNCAVNFAKFILNSNYFQYFTNSSNVGTYWPKCHFDYNEGTFHILQSKTHSNTAPFIICCNSNAIDFSLTHFDFHYYGHILHFSLIKKYFVFLNPLGTIFLQLSSFFRESVFHPNCFQAFEDQVSF